MIQVFWINSDSFFYVLSLGGVCVGLLYLSQDFSQLVSCKEKHITVKKEPLESLGMTVAGGRGSKSGELPIFVTSVQPHGCLSRDGRIKRGKRPHQGRVPPPPAPPQPSAINILGAAFSLSAPQATSC